MSENPEKIIQFGTGILLRGLPDFFIDKANKMSVFKGSIVVIKSTPGDVSEFSGSGNKFKTYVRGIQDGKEVKEEFENESISRVLSAMDSWSEILTVASNPQIQIIISNTTEVGLQYFPESVFDTPPESFPGKLTALLHARYKTIGNTAPEVLVIPTELIPGNGKLLKSIVQKLIAFNNLGPAFEEWMNQRIIFCDSLVDRIVTRPSASIQEETGDHSKLAIQTESYRLWAIEGDDRVKSILSFAIADKGVIIAENIDYYRERKLRLLNGTHTISVCLGFLNGFNTVYECMQDKDMRNFIESVMMSEIKRSMAVGSDEENTNFGRQVLDRFANPFSEHKLLSITFQSTMKMRMRNIPVIFDYQEKFGTVPELMVQGFAAYLLFMKSEKEEGGKYYGRRGNDRYLIQDDKAGYFHNLWNEHPPEDFVAAICSDTGLWGKDLSQIPGFESAVTRSLIYRMP